MSQMTGSDYALLTLIILAGMFLVLKMFEQIIRLKEMLGRRANKKVGIIDVTPDRWNKLREDVEDILEDGISRKMTDGEWTKEEGATIKRMFANIFDLKGLIPRGQLTLREQIMQRLAALGRLPEKFRKVTPAPPPMKEKTSEALRAMFKIN